MKTTNSKYKENINQAGNVMVYILLAIGLLASLGYAVMSSMNTSGAGLSKEKSNIYANEIMTYGNTLSDAIQNLILIENCEPTEISFAHEEDDEYENTLSPVSEECNLFSIEGAAITRLQSIPEINDGSPYIYGTSYIHAVGNGYDNAQCSSPNCSELVLFLKNIDKSVCESINKRLGIKDKFDKIPQDTGDAAMQKFSGTYAEDCGAGNCENWIGDSSSKENVLFGKKSGCFEGGGNPKQGTYHYYHVIYAQ